MLLCPWDFPGKNTGVGCYFLLQGIFLTHGLNPPLASPALPGGFFPLVSPGKPLGLCTEAGEKGFFELTTSPTHSLNLHHLHDIGISSQEINVKADSTNVN